MEYFEITEWARYQHYKDRNPPWIKLHRDMLTSQTWVLLADASKALAVACMLLAAARDNRIPMNPGYIKRAAYLTEDVDLDPLFECGFIQVVDSSKGHASKPAQTVSDAHKCSSREERQRGEEREEKKEGGQKRKRFVPPTLDEVSAYAAERKSPVNPTRFMAHYESVGWRVGKNRMQDWKAAFRGWEVRERADAPAASEFGRGAI